MALLKPDKYPAFANSVDSDQLASEASWSGSVLFAIQWIYIINLDQVIWKLEMGVAYN